MARYVLDPLTLVDVVARGLSVRPGHQLVAPGSIRSDALALLLSAVHRGELSEPAALARHERLTELKMRLLDDRVSRRTAWTIAREQGWTSLREARYLALTRLQADALVTVDAVLATAAAGLVPLAPLEALTADPTPP